MRLAAIGRALPTAGGVVSGEEDALCSGASRGPEEGRRLIGQRAGYRNVASLGPRFGGALVLWPPDPLVDRSRVDQLGEPVRRCLRPGVLIDDGRGAAVDVRGHVDGLQPW